MLRVVSCRDFTDWLKKLLIEIICKTQYLYHVNENLNNIEYLYLILPKKVKYFYSFMYTQSCFFVTGVLDIDNM